MRISIPLGIKLICLVYIANTALFVISLILFYSRILIFGNEAGAGFSYVIKFFFIFVPLFLYFRLPQLRKDAWVVAILFHIFFLVNNASNYLEYMGYSYSIVHITGLYGSEIYSPAQALIFTLSAIINLLILGYLYKRRHIFQ